MDVLKLLELDPMDVKGHLAVTSGIDNPIESFFDGRFEEWQQVQTKRNFGRLVVHFKRTGRNSYPMGENLLGRATIHSILPEPMAFQDFSDFKHLCLSRSELEMLYRHQYPSWKAALSSVSGVYLISDKLTGKQYVGSAYGMGGFWSRWSAYAAGHHGDNKLLRVLFNEKGAFGFSQFQYSILEVCDIDLSKKSVIEIECRWKRKLLSKEFGWNDN